MRARPILAPRPDRSRRCRAPRRPLCPRGFAAGLLAITLWLPGCAAPASDLPAVDDHTHAGGGVVTHWTGGLELFVEYPPHVQDVASEPWAIHLTWLEDWQPVRAGQLTLLLRGPGGAREEIVMAAPDRPGVFTATPTLTATGTWRADMTLAARDSEYAIPVGQLQVFESDDALPHDVEQPPPGLIALLKEQQWTMPFAVAVAEERGIARSISVTGEIAAPGDRLAQISTLVPGLVVASGPALVSGDPVSEGQTLALIAPTTLDNSYLRLRADVVGAQREAERAERLFAAGAIAESRVQRARHALEVALGAFQSVGGTPPGEEDGADPHLYHLRTPISGVISDRLVALGQQVESGTHAFTVVDPSTLWFVARVPARHAAALGDLSGAWFTVEGAQRVHTAGAPVSVGSVIDPESRTLPVRFAAPNPEQALKVGMLARGHLLVGEEVQGVAVPAAAIQDEDGLAVVYVKVGGEAFLRRVVEPGPSDGSWTIVASGVAAGEQVVTTGAYQVKLASLGDAEISDHGHPH